MLVHEFLRDAAQRRPQAVALIHGDVRRAYGALDARTSALARALLREGVRPGDRVGILFANSPEYVSSYYAVLKAGAIVVALNAAADARTIVEQLRDCEAAALLAGETFGPLLGAAIADLPAIRLIVSGGGAGPAGPHGARVLPLETVAEGESAEAPDVTAPSPGRAAIVYTSGSTGKPRGAVLRHEAIVANTRSIVGYLGLTERDRVLVVLPFHYVYGKSLLNTHVAAGGAVIIENRFLYPQVALDTLEREGATGLSGVPSTFAILLNRTNFASRTLPELRYVTQAGGPMAPDLTRRLVEALPGRRIFVMYGATEASARLSYLPPEDLMRKLGSVGRAIPGVTLDVLRDDGSVAAPGEVGEVVARGDNIMEGYWNDPDETARVLDAKGYHTGDLGSFDDEGFLWLAGRSREQIKSGAHRIHPKEIEEAILEHPAVHEAAVIGVPDETLGESIRAFVVLRAGAPEDEDSVLAHCRSRLPGYKVPKRVVFRDELPKGPTGKILKRELH
jgi:acyl-CoA synthetase (AMP-forming)/AMP-acid ligase II